jgi:fatty acid synthase subunit alpha
MRNPTIGAAAAAALVDPEPLSNPTKLYSKFPTLPDVTSPTFQQLRAKLRGSVDLRQCIVVTGFGEVGPWGSSRTRWEMEAYGEFSLEGCIELAWFLGLIKPHDGPLNGGGQGDVYIGWVDAQSGEAVADHEIKARYEETILKNSGIRVVDPECMHGYDAMNKRTLHHVAIDADMQPMEVASREEAQEIQDQVGAEFSRVYSSGSNGCWFVQVLKGAVVAVPKALRFDRYVAGQVPKGWDAKRLGVPEELADSVDPLTLYALVGTVEALVSSGITDPYEFYKYVHLSQVGNASGSGMGGMRSLQRLFHRRKLEEEIPSDTLAESFINTMPAWINMLLLSSTGPILTPVGACATAAESMNVAAETILSGKARVMVVGGFDDFGEEGSYEFAQMGATVSSDEEVNKGRLPREASRPMTDSRSGFLESHGSGIQIVMDAELAIAMGVPIYGIVALTNTATDRQGRSVPAPGQGILTTARETVAQPADAAVHAALLDWDFRIGHLRRELEDVEAWEKRELGEASASACRMHADRDVVMAMANKKRAAAYDTWGQGFYKGVQSIAPLRGALAVWGLSADDIDVGSFHGTSTKLNDSNESNLVHRQMEHIGRSKGNVMCVVAQKYLTGHPKGAAAAWMTNGMLQTMDTGLVPGNRNLDNVSPELRKCDYLFYPNRTIEFSFVRATLIKSFGFGQAGAEVLLVHPHYLLATLEDSDLQSYMSRRHQREQRAYRYQHGVLRGKHTLVQVKNAAPYTDAQQERVYLDPSARVEFQPSTNSYAFPDVVGDEPHGMRVGAAAGEPSPPIVRPSSASRSTAVPAVSAASRLQITAQEQAEGLVRGKMAVAGGVGVDVEPVATFSPLADKDTFIQRNFTQAEQAYCRGASSPEASFAGRWAAKEAVVKAITNAAPQVGRNLWQGGAAPLVDVEVLPSATGGAHVTLHGHAKEVFAALGLRTVTVSISHSSEMAIAQALAQ